MITGRQIREARALLKWTVPHLSAHAKVPDHIINRAESTDDTPSIMLAQIEAIKQAIEWAGVEFLNHSQPGARLRKQDQP